MHERGQAACARGSRLVRLRERLRAGTGHPALGPVDGRAVGRHIITYI